MLPAFLYLCCCIGFKNTLCAFILFMAFNVEVTIIEIERSKKCSINPWECLFASLGDKPRIKLEILENLMRNRLKSIYYTLVEF